MSLDSNWSDVPGLRGRFLFLSAAAIAILLILVMRLWYLQVISSERYHALSEKNRIRILSIAAPRGAIYDRDAHLLVENRPSFTISILRKEAGEDDKDQILALLSSYLDTDIDQLKKRWKEGKKYSSYQPLVMAEDVSRDAVEKIQENAFNLPGIITEVRPIRSYPHGEMASHLFGYLGEITEDELKDPLFGDYRSGNFVGKSGIEKYLDQNLRGVNGERLIEVNVKGKELRTLKTLEPQPGKKVYLTLRKDLQLAAEEALGDKAGAAVVVNVKTGEILAMANRPAFSPSLFARGITAKEWVSLVKNPMHPLQNKAVKGQYPPGSTFKIVTALAALKAGVATPSTSVFCEGKLTVGNRDFRCWKKHGHGQTDLKKAIRESCDVWFYKVAQDLGIDKIAEMARDLGLGESLGYSIDAEKTGLIPDRQWKKKRFGARWYEGETAIAAIGQGYVLATPLQLAVMTAAVANGGTVFKPQVVARVEGRDGEIVFQYHPEMLREAEIPAAALAAVRKGMEAVPNEPGGTGWASHFDEVRIAGKTGTSQVVKLRDDKDLKPAEIAYKHRDHALFVSYAPAEAPEIAVAVVVEHGEHGGSGAGPVARAIYAKYFGLEKKAVEPVVDADALPAYDGD